MASLLLCRDIIFGNANTQQTVHNSRQADVSYGRERYLVLTTSKLSSRYSYRHLVLDMDSVPPDEQHISF